MTPKYEIAIDSMTKKTFSISVHFFGTPKKVKADNVHFSNIKEKFNQHLIEDEFLIFKGLKKNKVLTIQNMINEL